MLPPPALSRAQGLKQLVTAQTHTFCGAGHCPEGRPQVPCHRLLSKESASGARHAIILEHLFIYKS
jgi:hypothetical protein